MGLAPRRQMLIRCRDRLIKAQRFNVAMKLAQRIETFGRAGAGIAHEIIEALFARDYDKMGNTVRQMHPHNDRISACEI